MNSPGQFDDTPGNNLNIELCISLRNNLAGAIKIITVSRRFFKCRDAFFPRTIEFDTCKLRFFILKNDESPLAAAELINLNLVGSAHIGLKDG